jgi:hypothetical protein
MSSEDPPLRTWSHSSGDCKSLYHCPSPTGTVTSVIMPTEKFASSPNPKMKQLFAFDAQRQVQPYTSHLSLAKVQSLCLIWSSTATGQSLSPPFDR